jgi:hypothetical protein
MACGQALHRAACGRRAQPRTHHADDAPCGAEGYPGVLKGKYSAAGRRACNEHSGSCNNQSLRACRVASASVRHALTRRDITMEDPTGAGGHCSVRVNAACAFVALCCAARDALRCTRWPDLAGQVRAAHDSDRVGTRPLHSRAASPVCCTPRGGPRVRCCSARPTCTSLRPGPRCTRARLGAPQCALPERRRLQHAGPGAQPPWLSDRLLQASWCSDPAITSKLRPGPWCSTSPAKCQAPPGRPECPAGR